MNFIRLIRNLFLFFSIILVTLVSCKTEVVRVEFDTEMVVNVVTELDGQPKPLFNATVAVFTTLEDYTKSIKLRTPVNALKSLITDNKGTITFNDLPSDKEIWVAAFYKDTSFFKGKTILYDNDNLNFELVEKFRKGSVNKVTIKLIPADGLITFNVTTAQPSFPVIFYLSDNTLTATKLSDTLSSVHKKGRTAWRARSGECDWYGVVDVNGGKISSIQLPECQTGLLGFYSNVLDFNEYPITIRFVISPGVLEDVAILDSPFSDLPNGGVPTCNDFNNNGEGIVFDKGAGTYTYDAISASGKYRWTGRIQSNVGQCTVQLLPTRIQ